MSHIIIIIIVDNNKIIKIMIFNILLILCNDNYNISYINIVLNKSLKCNVNYYNTLLYRLQYVITRYHLRLMNNIVFIKYFII